MTAVVATNANRPDVRRVELDVSGMTCSACAARIEAKLNKLEGVHASVNYATRVATIDATDPVDAEQLCAVVRRAGYEAEPRTQLRATRPDPDSEHARGLLVRLAVAAVLFVPLADLSVMLAVVPNTRFEGWQWVLTGLAIPIVTWAAWPFHKAALRNARHGTASMETLISIGVTAATVWSFATIFSRASASSGPSERHGVWRALLDSDAIYLEVAAGITVFVLAGRYFEAERNRRPEVRCARWRR